VTALPLATLLALFVGAGAGPTAAPWSDETALVLPERRAELGVFTPLRYGLRDRVEVSVHPALFLVAPNASTKIAWGAPAGIALASDHSLLYPTQLMRLLSRSGAGGIVPPDVRYPQILATSHHLLASAPIGEHLVTLRAGGTLAWNLTAFEGPRFWSDVEWHLVRPRIAAWLTGVSADAGLAADGPVAGAFRYRLELDRFFLPGLRGDWAWEWAALAEWRPSTRFRLRAGAKWSYAAFPYGTRLSVPLPLVDAAWGWGGSGRG
jgi:hypothetical protein